MKRILIAGVFVLSVAVGATAQSLGLFDGLGTSSWMAAMPAPVGFTCYNVDSGYELVHLPERKDIISTWQKKLPDGRTRVCHVRPAEVSYSWITW